MEVVTYANWAFQGKKPSHNLHLDFQRRVLHKGDNLELNLELS